ncbi:MAG: hypothetical protein AAF581_04455 [Planctomycetota bacterium]
MRVLVLLLCLTAVTTLSGQKPQVGLGSHNAVNLTNRYGDHLQPVSIWLRRFEGLAPRGELTDPWREQRPFEATALAVDPHTLWMADFLPDERFVDHITVGVDGKLKARLHARFVDAFGWVLKTDKPMPGVRDLQFVPVADIPSMEQLVSVWRSREDAGWALTATHTAGRFRTDRRGPSWIVGSGVLLASLKDGPVGFSFDRSCLVDTDRATWPGAKLKEAALVTQERYGVLQTQWRDRAEDLLPTVRIVLSDEQEESARRQSMWDGDDEGGGPNLIDTSGYVIGPRRVLVHHSLSRAQALRIESIEVVHRGHSHEAKFIGAYKDFGAFICELEEGTDLPQAVRLEHTEPLGHNQSLLMVAADHSSGRRRVWVEFNRVRRYLAGYRNVEEPILYSFQRPGAIAVDVRSDQVVAAVVEVRRVQQERHWRRSGTVDLRVMTGAEIAEMVQAAEYDPQLRPGDKEERKQVVWLGVNYQELDRDLAKMYGVEIKTRGGTRGVLVNHVYAGSPAARIGLAVGDVLLQFTDPKSPDPVYIEPRGDREYRFPPPPELGEAHFGDYLAMAGPPWRNVRNYLQKRLTKIGEGQKISLTYLRGSDETTVEVTLEASPPDAQSASKQKIEPLGVTVRDLTYEVRDFYRLPADATGVVVAKVEPGGAAAVANLVPHAVVRELGGRPVKDAADFKKHAEELLASGTSSIEVRMEFFGRSRLLRMVPGAD